MTSAEPPTPALATRRSTIEKKCDHDRHPTAGPGAIDRLVESGAERGLQVAVYRNGEPVVDAVAGLADPATRRPVISDTPFYAYSTGKGATSTVAHVLVERGFFG